jgi:hypothetical protein
MPALDVLMQASAIFAGALMLCTLAGLRGGADRLKEPRP